ncbi:hypothetical protein [Bacillus sp. AFS018417]|nr:hypothetical protein [Bacillus sp. AFS018417]
MKTSVKEIHEVATYLRKSRDEGKEDLKKHGTGLIELANSKKIHFEER